MDYLLIMRLLLAATVMVGFAVRYLAVLRHKSDSGDNRLGFVILVSVLLYGGLLLASIDKITYLSVFATAAVLLSACFVLEIILQKVAKYVSRQSSRASAIRYYG